MGATQHALGAHQHLAMLVSRGVRDRKVESWHQQIMFEAGFWGRRGQKGKARKGGGGEG